MVRPNGGRGVLSMELSKPDRVAPSAHCLPLFGHPADGRSRPATTRMSELPSFLAFHQVVSDLLLCRCEPIAPRGRSRWLRAVPKTYQVGDSQCNAEVSQSCP